jgi:hypothetical protein
VNMQYATRMHVIRIGTVIAAGAMAVGITLLTAPPAGAIPESTIKSECAAANGEYFSQVNPAGQRVSSCCYKDYKGKKYCDMYIDGVYQVVQLPTTTPPTRGFQPPEQTNPGSVSQR